MLTSFEPILGDVPKVLILGSMPGVVSLHAAHYYAHPRNAMWPIIFEYLEVPLPEHFEARYVALKNNQFAMWDVLKHCERQGSLDSAIQTSTEVPNDIVGLLVNYPSIELVCLNGAKAAHAFKKYISPSLKAWQGNIITLPSTSPANARTHYREKKRKWHEVFNLLS